MRYAIFSHGGKQYFAEEGAQVEVDRMPQAVGQSVEFQEVLLMSDGKSVEVGSPHVSGAMVRGTVVEHPNGRKIIVFKHHPKHRYRRTKGQRQRLTRISIETVGVPGAAEPAEAPARKTPAAPTRKTTAKSTAKRAAAKPRAAKTSAPTRKKAAKSKPARPKKKSG